MTQLEETIEEQKQRITELTKEKDEINKKMKK